MTIKSLKLARKAMKMTQDDIGKVLGCHQRVMSNIEAGKRALTQDETTVLIKYFAEKGIDLTDPDLFKKTPSRRLIKIVVTKQFDSIDIASMTEIVIHAQSIKKIGDDWEVSCDLLS